MIKLAENAHRLDSYLSKLNICHTLKINTWITLQEEKYKHSINDYKNKLDEAIIHENPEGAERAASALIKAQWYMDNIIPLIGKKKSKKK